MSRPDPSGPDMSGPAPFRHVALIGLGLIASSMAHALRARWPGIRLTGYARSEATRAEAREVGFCDTVADSAAEAVAGADLVVLAVPVGAMGAVAAEVAPHLAPGAVMTDVGSVKQAVIEAVGPHLPSGAVFVPGHPLAGTEHSGPRSGFATLFQNRWWLLTPPPGTDPGAVERLAALIRGMGAKVDTMEAAHHDRVLAVTSHAPHLIAYTMVGVADHLSRVTESEVIQYSAAGFRDFTRIAASDPTMWRDVFLTNREATLDILGRFVEELFVLQRAIRMGDGAQLHDYFTRTRAIRRGIIDAGQDTAAPDFGRVARPTEAAPGGVAQGGFAQAGAAEVGITQDGVAQAEVPQAGIAQAVAAQTGAKQTGAKQTGAKQTGAKQAGAKQTETKQAGGGQAGIAKTLAAGATAAASPRED